MAGEDTKRGEDYKTRKGCRQQVNVIHDHSRPRSEDPKRPYNTRQETPRASQEKSKKPTINIKTRPCPVCRKLSGNKWKWKMHFEEVHQDAMVECRGCPKKYKYVYNRSRPKKIHHQAPCSAAGVNPRSALTVRKIDLTRSGRRLTAYKPENDSSEESAQRRGMWQDQGETIYSYLEARKTCMPVGPPGRTEPQRGRGVTAT